jgi:diguanylate cyclase (GGDEF)-like protein
VDLYYTGVRKNSSKTAGHELKSLLVIFAVIFLVNTPTSYLESALYPYLFDKINVWTSVFEQETELIGDYARLVENDIIKQEFANNTQVGHTNDLIEVILDSRREGFVTSLQLLTSDEFQQSSGYLASKISLFFYNETNIGRPFVNRLTYDQFTFYYPVRLQDKIAGYLALDIDKSKFSYATFERVFYLSDGGVVTEGRTDYPLADDNWDEQLWIELDKATIYKDSGIIDYQDHLILFQKVPAVDESGDAYLFYFISPTETFLYYLPKMLTILVCVLLVSAYIYYEFYKHSRRLRDKAHIDELSRLYNRAYYNKIKNKFLNADYYLGILDIDHFKLVNDHYGHDVGDDVIRKVGLSLKDGIRARDYAFRVGGEEFVIILKCDSYEHAEVCFERLRENIASISTKPPVTASLGFTRMSYSPDKTFKVADQQLYKAKDAGRDQSKGILL